ncbi:secreted RxLR effector peptide protein, putative [Phytophthora infestans T30-4]|uniref:RxLR effector protein n=2 Tax=Phytophthora infestans TaxID=4787 RepID=D0N132_PHYIT|nr:secreted RxLR effector peptide protein, putative [Phytophthora infestans T30-4]EEY67345.1 secreted RxLR effector peptide protein, putative [Phytophthora infestans T30-4]KAF4045574.1 RXLR domain-containing protein [Phytophthora infestans]|eukprot:XP_002905993.1 secreted RxLR effector peptide protein, putative [Phytophthora infestans T30-4]
MRLSPIFIGVAAAITASSCAVSTSTLTQHFSAGLPASVQPVDTAIQKSARFLRSPETEEEERGRYDFPFLVSEGAAREMAKRISDNLDSTLMSRLSAISNGKTILNRWRNEGLSLAEVKPLLKEAGKWGDTSERAVYKLLKSEGLS